MLIWMRSRLTGRLGRDDGLTLPELLISTVISGLMITSVGATIVVALQLMDQSSSTLGDSGNTMFSSAYFSTDVQEASTVTVSGSANCGSGDVLIDFSGTDFGSPPQPPDTLPVDHVSHVSYTTATVSAPGVEDTISLIRRACWAEDSTAPLPLTPQSEITLATGLSATSPPTVTCYQQAADAAALFALGNVVDCTDPLMVMSVVTLTPSSDAPQFQLIGTRRST